MDKKIRIFITGSTGFIGRSLIEELCARGYVDITTLVRRTSDTSFLENKGLKIIAADITDKASLDSIVGTYDVLFHCAGYLKNRNKDLLENVNIRGTENIFQWALERGIRKSIYVSSVSVNSGHAGILRTEDMPYNAVNQYGLSKIAAEKIALKFRNNGLPMIIVRPGMVYGKGEPHMMKLLAMLIKSRLFLLPDCGRVSWHLASVRNVSACLIHCLEDDRALGGTFNIADKEVLTVREVMKILSRHLGVHQPLLLPHPLTRIFSLIPFVGKRIKFLCTDHIYSIERLEKILGFTPPYRAETELADMAEYFRYKRPVSHKKTKKNR